MLTPETFREIVSGRRQGLAAAGARGILSLAEVAYRSAITRRNRRYDRGHGLQRVAVPVISVGNLTLGGTGKTPMVAWLAGWFRDRQVRVVLVSRGYGARTPDGNDELKELAERLPDVPHLQDADRTAAARTAIEKFDAQLILLDDGFQHRRLVRDLDLVLVDATEPFGYERIFPRGMLREPIASLGRADMVALTRSNLVEHSQREALRRRIEAVAPRAAWLEVAQQPSALRTAHGNQLPLDQLPAGPVLAFSGIGNPAAFRQTLEQLGWSVEAVREFRDHQAYDRATRLALERWAVEHPRARSIVCTHKDLVKIGVDGIGPLPLFALQLEMRLESGRAALEAKLRSLLPSAGPS